MKRILALALGLLIPFAHADQAFKDFVPAQPAAATQTGTETFPEVQSLATAKVTTAQIASYTLGTLTSGNVIGTFTGTCDVSHFLRGDGACALTPTGTVTSVALTVPSWLTVAGSPVTTSGTLAVTAAGGQTANQFIATPNGSTGAVGLRSIVAADLPTISLTSGVTGILGGANGGTANGFMQFTGPASSLKTYTLPNASVNILTDNAAVTVPQGGTGVGTLTAHGVLLGEGTSNVSAVAAMAADTLLQGQGASADPVAVSVPSCGSSTQALSYNTSTHAFGCQTISGSGVAVTQVFKGSSTSRASTTTPTADPDLTFASVPSGQHALKCHLNVALQTSGTTPGLKVQWSVGGTLSVTGNGNWVGQSNGTLIGSNGSMTGALSLYTAAVNGNNDGWEFNVGFVTTTSGAVTLLWSQQNSSSNTTALQAGSWCQIT